MAKSNSLKVGLLNFVGGLLPLVLLIGLFFYGYLGYRNDERMTKLRSDESHNVNNALLQVNGQFESIISDLIILAKNDALKGYVRDQGLKADVARVFNLIAKERRSYDHISYIDSSGAELIVINYEGNRPYLEWPANLRDLSGSVYFRNLLALKPGVVHVSNFELGLRDSEVEYPLKPIVKVATGVYGSNGDIAGVVVLTVRGEVILRPIRQQWSQSSAFPLVVDDRGQIVMGLRRNQEWGLLLGHNSLFGSEYSDGWALLAGEPEGQVLVDSGLYTFATLSAQLLAQSTAISNRIAMTDIGQNGISRDYSLKIVGYVPKARLEELTAVTVYNWIAVISALLFAVVIALLFARFRLHQVAAERRVRLAAHVEEVTRDGVIIYDSAGHIVSVNPAFTMLTGFLPHEVIGKSESVFRSNESLEGDEPGAQLIAAHSPDSVVCEVMAMRADGSRFPIATNISALRDHDGTVDHFIEIFSDISLIKVRESSLVRQAYYDALTEIPNRLLFEDRLKVAVKISKRRDEKFGLLFVDLDDFKQINDEYGHEAGDLILREAASRMTELVRESDTVARMGGDEFVIIASDIKGHDNARQLAEKIADSLRKPIAIKDMGELSISASIGISIYPDDDEDYSHLTKIADFDMYRQKAQHKSQSVLKGIGKDE